MAKDNENGKKAKSASKKDRKEPKNWAKILVPLLLVFIMVVSIFAYMFSGSRPNTGGSDTGVNKKFDNIMDGLRLIPANASSARYVDLKNDSILSDNQNKYRWLVGSLPPTQVYNAKPQRDLFAIYPAGFFGNFAEQFVSLTDFGRSSINKSYKDYYDINGVIAKMVNAKYVYTAETVPVVNGRIDSVAPVIFVMTANNSSAYGDYSDLFDELKWKQIPVTGKTLEVVGKASNLSYSDRYYAAIGPVNPSNKSADRLYSYVAVLHVNTTIQDDARLNLALLEGAMEKMGFKSYRTQVYDDYIVIEAEGSLGMCIDDMQNRWGFIKYQASL